MTDGAHIGDGVNPALNLTQLLLIAGHEAEVHTLLRQFKSDRGANTTVRAGHDRAFSVQSKFHSGVPRYPILDKHAGIGQKEQLFTPERHPNHDVLATRVRMYGNECNQISGTYRHDR